MNGLDQRSVFYVSQTGGNDAYDGDRPTAEGEHGPFRTLERALEEVRSLRAAGVGRPLTVALTEDYLLRAPIDFSGLCGVTLQSHQGRSRIVGGVRIEGWRQDRFNGVACLSAALPEGALSEAVDLFVNGRRAAPTRFPKEGALQFVDAENSIRGPHVPASEEHMQYCSKWVRVRPEDLAAVENVTDAMLHYNHYWVDEHTPIESYDPRDGRIVMAYHSRFTVGVSYDENPNAAPPYYLTNVANMFSEPGEWYLDRTAQRVYYIPKEDAEWQEPEAWIPSVDRLVVAVGCEDVRVRNLEFFCTHGEYASTFVYNHPYSAYASDIQAACTGPGALFFKNARRCAVSDCEIHGVGIYAVEIAQDCADVRVENCHMYDLCAGGVRITGSAADAEQHPTHHCVIRGNRIHGCGKRYLAGCGVLLMHASNCEISYNEIHDLEYSGISVGWVWGYKDNASYGNLIHHNHVYDVGKGNLSDMGGIYVLGIQRGTVISENRVHDVACYSYGAWGIYLDEGSSYMTVENNVVYRTGKECFHLHFGSHNTVRNNVFYGSGVPCIRISRDEAHDQVLFEGNLLVTEGAPVYGVLKDPHGLRARRNVCWDMKRETPVLYAEEDGRAYGEKEWRETFLQDGDSIFEDPRLADVERFDFRITKDSPAARIGFCALKDEVAREKS